MKHLCATGLGAHGVCSLGGNRVLEKTLVHHLPLGPQAYIFDLGHDYFTRIRSLSVCLSLLPLCLCPHRVGAYAEGHPRGILLQVYREVHPCKVSLEVHTGGTQSFWHRKIKARSPLWAVSAELCSWVSSSQQARRFLIATISARV